VQKNSRAETRHERQRCILWNAGSPDAGILMMRTDHLTQTVSDRWKMSDRRCKEQADWRDVLLPRYFCDMLPAPIQCRFYYRH
jgi:hypothetical protein